MLPWLTFKQLHTDLKIYATENDGKNDSFSEFQLNLEINYSSYEIIKTTMHMPETTAVRKSSFKSIHAELTELST